METFADIIEYYDCNSDEWLYYKGRDFTIGKNVLSNGREALEFIKDYFNIGGKGSAIIDLSETKLEEIKEERLIHIVSTFFLGLKIAKCFGIKFADESGRNMPFQYYWFLTCLYHDLGYIYEEDFDCENLRAVSVNGLEAIQEICDIKYIKKMEFITYAREVVDLYLKGRATCQEGKTGVIDHGIAGGLMLYDKLRKNYEEAWKNRKNRNDSKNSFDIDHKGRELRFSRSHYYAYAKAADAIIAHNIFKSTLSEYASKNQFELSDNLPEKIGMNKKLCFILCVADTIEPLKRCKNLIEKVRFSFEEKSFTIEASDCAYDKVYRNIRSMEDWLDIKVSVDNKVITISL